MRVLTVLMFLLWSLLAVVSSEALSSSLTEDESIASVYLIHEAAAAGKYRVHGWRWHTMSVLRELKLLQNLLQKEPYPNKLHELVQHTIGFNLKGLNRVESLLFFPWLKNKFDLIQEEPTRKAFQCILTGVEEQQKQLMQQGQVAVRNGIDSCDTHPLYTPLAHTSTPYTFRATNSPPFRTRTVTIPWRNLRLLSLPWFPP